MLVVVPVRNEAERLPACLDALAAAAAAVPAVRVHLLVVLDRCRDDSALVVAARPAVRALVVDVGSAGAARRLGVAAGLAALHGVAGDGRRLWIASTDADSRVPADWLAVHVATADAGADLLLGTVVPEPGDLTPDLHARWAAGYRAVEGHQHVHGANLGIRASTYRAVGGFPALPTGEDVALALAVEAAGGRVVATAHAPVVTSGRLRGRAPDGFAGHLWALATGVDTEVA